MKQSLVFILCSMGYLHAAMTQVTHLHRHLEKTIHAPWNDVLKQAVMRGDTSKIKKLLAGNRIPDITITTDSAVPLFIYAAQQSYHEIVQLFINEKIDVNITDDSDETALMWAADYGHAHIVDLLLAHGAHHSLQNCFGETALILGVSGGYNIVYALLNAGADPNIQSDDGKTALMWAVILQKPHIVQLLVAFGADPDIQNEIDNHKTALDYASLESKTEMLIAIETGKKGRLDSFSSAENEEIVKERR